MSAAMSQGPLAGSAGQPPPKGADKTEAPPPFPPPVKATIAWLQRRFGSFYADNPPPLPDRHTKREFGFILWPERPGPPPFLRHRAYPDKERLYWYLRKVGPHSCYYSTAYYRHPAELKMADKQWLGAELIFDLDADHLDEVEAAKAGGTELGLERQLALVKKKFVTLLDEFLLGDFGLGENDLWITFSGGRGYHAHVTHPKLMQLDAKARREIVDYVTANLPAKPGTEDPDLGAFLWDDVVQVHGQGPYAKKSKMLRTHPADAPGWQGRMTRTLVQELRRNVLERPPVEAMDWLAGFRGVGQKSAAQFVERLDEKKLRLVEKGSLGLDPGGVFKRVIPQVIREQALPLAKGETDEPVTADVKRLIRLPGSLHGKTGLRVVTLTRAGLDDFDPFRDAVAWQGGSVRFMPRNDNEVRLGGERVAVTAGEETEVPTAHAVFWAARQQGTVLA